MIMYYAGAVVASIAVLMITTLLASLYFNDGSGKIKISNKHPVYYLMYVSSVPFVFFGDPLILFENLPGRGIPGISFFKSIQYGINEWIQNNTSLCSFFWRNLILGSILFLPSIAFIIIMAIAAILLFVISHIILAIFISLRFCFNFVIENFFNLRYFNFYLSEAKTYRNGDGISLYEWVNNIYNKKPELISKITKNLIEEKKYELNGINYILRSLLTSNGKRISSGDGYINTFHILQYSLSDINEKDLRYFQKMLSGWLYANNLIDSEKEFKSIFKDASISLNSILLNKQINNALVKNIKDFQKHPVLLSDENIKSKRFEIIKGFYRKTLCPIIEISQPKN